MRPFFTLPVAALCLLAAGAHAQQQPQVQFKFNGPMGAAAPASGNAQAGGLAIGEEQKLMFEASSKVMKKDYEGALEAYNKAIAVNGANIQAYIQRGVVRRELGDTGGARADGLAAAQLANGALAQNPNSASLYYQRGSAMRLLKDYDRASADIQHAIQLSGGQRRDWQGDLNAIELDKKFNPQ